MLTFLVPDMNCTHCANTITKAIKNIDPDANVAVDLSQHQITIIGTASEAEIRQLIHDAGYSPEKQPL